MKELWEYKEEIFRRSEEKLRLRKKRRAAVAVSLAACLVLVCLPLLPAMMPTASKSNNAGMEQADCMLEEPAQGIGWAEVTKENRQWSINDPDTLRQISDLLTAAVDQAADFDQPIQENMADHPTVEIYELTLMTPQGKTLFCNLHSGRVTDETGNTGILTRDALAQLEELLNYES